MIIALFAIIICFSYHAPWYVYLVGLMCYVVNDEFSYEIREYVDNFSQRIFK